MKKKIVQLTALFSFCLTPLLLLMLGPVPKSYAATLAPNRPHSGSCLALPNTGVSYNANAYTVLMYTISDNGQVPIGMFSFKRSNAPAIGAWSCANEGPLLIVGNAGAGWYNVRTTVNGVTTQTTQNSDSVYNLGGGYVEFGLPLSGDQQYIFQVQSCSHLKLRTVCSSWSPKLQVVTAANSSCLKGYVWREAAPFDHVCVTPAERSQAAYDNSQASSRINPSGAHGPLSCVKGYDWRKAFGGDYVCVTPAQRSLVAYDNSQALARIVAL